MKFIEDYVEFASPLTEAPRAFHTYMAYCLLSMAVGRRATYAGAGPVPLSPNLWMIFIGPSSLTKKSTTLRIGPHHILSHVFKDEVYRYPYGGSKEAFIEQVSEQPAGIILHSEFASLLGWMNQSYNRGLMSHLTNFYDQPEEERIRVGTRDKARTYSVKSPHLNIACCTTLPWFQGNLNSSQIEGGFLARFNLIYTDHLGSNISVSPDPDMDKRNELVWFLEEVRRHDYGLMKLDRQTKEFYHEWYCAIKNNWMKDLDPVIVPHLDRRRTDACKFALLNRIMRDPGNTKDGIGLSDMENAVSYAESIMNYTEKLLGGRLATTKYQVDRQKVLDAITTLSAENGGAKRKDIIRRTRIQKKYFNDIIDSLLDEETISYTEEQIPRPQGGGTVLTRYHLKDKYNEYE